LSARSASAVAARVGRSFVFEVKTCGKDARISNDLLNASGR